MATITTVIPTYRRPKLLARAVRSVLAQTYQDFEVLICDNASNDETALVAREFARRDRRIKYHCHAENIGIIRNFAYGIEQVSTLCFDLLSDDDILLPNFFETAIRSFSNCPEAAVFVGGLVEIDGFGNILNVPFREWSSGLHQPPELFFKLLSSGPNSWTSMVWRREIVSALQGLDEDVGLAADLDFELKALSHFPAVIAGEPCAMFVIHPQSASETRLSALAFTRAMVRMVQNLAQYSPERLLRSEMLAAMNARFRDIAFVRARAAAVDGSTTEAIEVARILEQQFHAPAHARCIRRLASSSCLGVLSRAAISLVRPPRRALRAAAAARRFRSFSGVVRNYYRSGSCAPSEDDEVAIA